MAAKKGMIIQPCEGVDCLERVTRRCNGPIYFVHTIARLTYQHRHLMPKGGSCIHLCQTHFDYHEQNNRYVIYTKVIHSGPCFDDMTFCMKFDTSDENQDKRGFYFIA